MTNSRIANSRSAGVVDHYLPAWQTTEPAGPGWFFAPEGEFVWAGVETTTADQMWQSRDWSGLQVVPPVLIVDDDTAVVVTAMGGSRWVNILEFNDEFLIVRHISTYPA